MPQADLKIGLFGIGLDTYWSQFSGLKERLEGYMKIVEHQLAAIQLYISPDPKQQAAPSEKILKNEFLLKVKYMGKSFFHKVGIPLQLKGIPSV